MDEYVGAALLWMKRYTATAAATHHHYIITDLIWIFPYLHFRTTWLAVLLNCNILKSDFRIKRFSNKPTTLVIYYYRIKHFLPLVSKVGLLFVLFFSVLRECFFLPVSISLPWRIFLPRSSWEKNRPGAKNGHGEEKTSLWTEKRVRKGPLFSTRDEITIMKRQRGKKDLIWK